MQQELQALKEELARVRAREKRYKDNAEAQIAALQEQLETMTAAKNRVETAKNELESCCLQQDAESATLHARVESLQTEVEALLTAQRYVESQRSKFENRCTQFGEENAQLQKKLLSSTSELEKLKLHCHELKNENARFRKVNEDQKRNLVLINIVCEKIHVASVVSFFQEHECDLLAQLQQQGTHADLDLVTLIRRCIEEEDMVAAVWRAIRTLVSKGDTEPAAAKECLQGLLSWYNQNTQNELQAFNISTPNGLFSALSRVLNDKADATGQVLLPGLANRIGIILVGPLLRQEDK